MSNPLRTLCLLFTLAYGFMQPAGATLAAELRVAVASNFLGTLQKLAPVYEKHSGNQLLLSAGASGQLYAQIAQGAPFDVFLSADAERPRLLEEKGLAVPGDRFTYAIGKLALWSPKTGVIDADGKFLGAGKFRYIAIANPSTAPYGLAASQVLEKLQLWPLLQQRKQLVTGESIAQAMQFAASGNADAAFVALSEIIGSDGRIAGSYWLPPASLYAPILQDAALLSASTRQAEARNFLQWLRTDTQVLKNLQAAGYELPARP